VEKGGGTPAYTLRPHYALAVRKARAGSSLFTQGWIGDKPCLVTIDTKAYVTVSRPDIAAECPERQANQRYILQTYIEALRILKKNFLTLTLRRRPLTIRVFVEDITNEFNLGLDILRAYDASMDLVRQMSVLHSKRYRYGAPGWDPSLQV
jgi:hypothetical protein